MTGFTTTFIHADSAMPVQKQQQITRNRRTDTFKKGGFVLPKLAHSYEITLSTSPQKHAGKAPSRSQLAKSRNANLSDDLDGGINDPFVLLDLTFAALDGEAPSNHI